MPVIETSNHLGFIFMFHREDTNLVRRIRSRVAEPEWCNQKTPQSDQRDSPGWERRDDLCRLTRRQVRWDAKAIQEIARLQAIMQQA